MTLAKKISGATSFFLLLGFIAGCPLLCMAKTTKMSKSGFSSKWYMFLVRRRLRRRRFSFLYKETFLYEVTALCGRASEGPFTLFFMCILVDARFATLVGQANH